MTASASLKERLKKHWNVIQHSPKHDCLALSHAHALLIDRAVLDAADSLHRKSPPIAVAAIGGYGRCEMAPFSDIDILITHDLKPADIATFARKLQEKLWAEGIKPSCQTIALRDLSSEISRNHEFTTSLLDRRFIWGSKKIFQQLEQTFRQYQKSTPAHIFITQKMEERDARHLKMGDTRYRLEPNVKESKGALRDLQSLLWLSKALYGIKTPAGMVTKKIFTPAEAKTLQKAYAFFWTVRCHLHALSGRATERLSFDIQPEIAARMGYTDKDTNARAEQFMKDYFLLSMEVGHLTRILCADVEARALALGGTSGTRKLSFTEKRDGFPIRNNRLSVEKNNHFSKNPDDMVRLFLSHQASGLDIHPDAYRAIRSSLKKAAPKLQKSKHAFELFMTILSHPRKSTDTLRRMNESGVLSALIPDFDNIRAHMQYDMFHTYTADEHTLRAVGFIHELESGKLRDAAPLATQLFKVIHAPRVLYAAMFLHDIAKGTGHNHAEEGARIARKICPHMGLTAEESETVAWLVEHHLLMTMTVLKRDLNDAKTINDFAAAVQSPERLKLLTILTTADVMAVGADRWNNWKSGLITDLFQKSEQFLLGIPPESPQEKEFLSHADDSHETCITIKAKPSDGVSEVTVYTDDRHGLFATLTGALAVSGASVVDARIRTLKNGMALDTFYIQGTNGKLYENDNFLAKTIRKAIAAQINMSQEISSHQKLQSRRAKNFSVQPRVIIDNSASNDHTVIEINAKDRPGLLHDVARALSAENLQIHTAKVSTFGSRAVDVFYVRDSFGLKIVNAEKLRVIEENVRLVL